MACIYLIKCSCGQELHITSIKLDNSSDLLVDVDECPNCKQINYDEGYAEAERNAI